MAKFRSSTEPDLKLIMLAFNKLEGISEDFDFFEIH